LGGVFEDLELVPIEDGTLASALAAAPASTKRTVLSVKGGVLVSQDGAVMRYRKKCRRCRFTDVELTTMPIRAGVTSMNFYCSKCGEHQQVEIRTGDWAGP